MPETNKYQYCISNNEILELHVLEEEFYRNKQVTRDRYRSEVSIQYESIHKKNAYFKRFFFFPISKYCKKINRMTTFMTTFLWNKLDVRIYRKRSSQND